MRFAIGLENINYSLPQIEDKVTQAESNVVDDNLTELQLQDHSHAFESLNNEVDLMLKGYDIVGTEADETQKKRNIFLRIWDAIVKMFKTLGKWVRDGYKWVAKKFGFGGNSNINTINVDVVAATAEAGSMIASELKSNDKKADVESNTTIKEDEVAVEKATIEKIIESSINKAFSKKTSIKNAKALKHNIQEQYKKAIIYSDSKELAVVDKSNNSPLDVMLINIARVAKNTIEIPFMFFGEDVLKRFENEDFLNGDNTHLSDDGTIRYSKNTIRERREDGETDPYRYMIPVVMIFEYIPDCIYLNAVMLNTLSNTNIDTKALDEVRKEYKTHVDNGDNFLKFAKAKDVVADTLAKFKEAVKSDLSLNLKAKVYTLELHNIIADGDASYSADKAIINAITDDREYKLNEKIYKMLDKCINSYVNGFEFIERILNNTDTNKFLSSVDDTKTFATSYKRHLNFCKSMLVDAKEISKLSLKFLSNTNKLVANNVREFDKLNSRRFMTNKYGE